MRTSLLAGLSDRLTRTAIILDRQRRRAFIVLDQQQQFQREGRVNVVFPRDAAGLGVNLRGRRGHAPPAAQRSNLPGPV